MPDSPTTQTALHGDTAPCVGCGMCCDGTIFGKAKAAPGEDDRLASYGLVTFQEGEKRYFPLPCPHHDCGKCGIYSERFTICRSFHCFLLTSYQAGEITLEEARSKVQEAQRLRSAIAEDEPRAVLWTERQGLKTLLAASKQSPRLLLNMVAFERYLDRWFRKRRGSQDTAASPVSTAMRD